MNYCLGFMFDFALQNVVLIRKKRPVWQEGLLNGVGGKLEQGESPIQAMVREFREETGIVTTESDWMYRFSFYGNFGCIYLFIAVQDLKAEDISEPVIVKPVKEIFRSKEVIQNLWWMIPLCLDMKVNGSLYLASDFYSQG